MFFSNSKWNLSISDKLDRIGSAGILSNARVGVVHFAVLFIHNEFLQYRFGLWLSDCGRIGGVSVGVDDPWLGVSLGQSLVDEVNFADQLRS